MGMRRTRLRRRARLGCAVAMPPPVGRRPRRPSHEARTACGPPGRGAHRTYAMCEAAGLELLAAPHRTPRPRHLCASGVRRSSVANDVAHGCAEATIGAQFKCVVLCGCAMCIVIELRAASVYAHVGCVYCVGMIS